MTNKADKAEAPISSIRRDAQAVLLPAFSDLVFDPAKRAHFCDGGVSMLLGCTRAEYVARRMSGEWVAQERVSDFLDLHVRIREIAEDVLFTIDYELGGVHRLHVLGPQLRHPQEAASLSIQEIENHGRAAGEAARHLGITLVLAPVLDVVLGDNPWLRNRTVSSDPVEVSRCTSAYIRGLQSVGVAATAKHFPGHSHLPLDPFDSATTRLADSREVISAGLAPFRSAVASGVKAVMTGPVPIDAIDPSEPASTSPVVVDVLRNDIGFDGLIISDDLDLPGTMRGRKLEGVALQSLNAGVQLLLLEGQQCARVAASIVEACEAERLSPERLSTAAEAVRRLARSLA